jgi:hypothetical protein
VPDTVMACFCASVSFCAAVDIRSIFIMHNRVPLVYVCETHTTRTGLCVSAPCLSLTMAGSAVSDCMFYLPPLVVGLAP